MTFKWHGLSLIPHGTSIDFIRLRHFTYAVSILITLITFAMLWAQGLNLGIDFKGGILIEIQTKGPANLKELRDHVAHLELGEVALQEFGRSDEVLIRLARQEGGEQGQIQAISKIQKALGEDVSFRRIETVGPKMGEELVHNGIYAVFWCLVANSIMRLRTSIIPLGSKPLVGSSKIISRGSCTRAMAMPNRCFIPCEKVLTVSFALWARPTLSN